jgi:hypothetical protein
MIIRDIILTILAWILFIAVVYNAFLYVENTWLNKIPNPTKQQLIDIKEFLTDIKIYIIITAVLIVYITLRLAFNLKQWYNSKHIQVNLPIVTAEEQAVHFNANIELVKKARANKIAYISIDSETGDVAEIDVV